MMDILVCPVCKGALELRVDDEDEQEVLFGAICCSKCQQEYPIVDTIPNMIPPDAL
jgi:uncharacterized protein YbaR (Trm112 family)